MKYYTIKPDFTLQYKSQIEWHSCKDVFPIGAFLFTENSDIVKVSNGINIYNELEIYYSGEFGVFLR